MFANVVNFGLTEMAIEVFCSALHIFSENTVRNRIGAAHFSSF